MSDDALAPDAPDPEELKRRTQELAADARKVLANKANASGGKGMQALSRKLDEAAGFLDDAGLNAAINSEGKLQPEHVEKVTAPIRSAARYLEGQDPKGLMTDIDAAVQKHPYRAIAVGVACGWVIGKLFSSK